MPPAETYWSLCTLVFVRFGRRQCDLCELPHCWQLVIFAHQRYACWEHLPDVVALLGQQVVPAFTPAQA